MAARVVVRAADVTDASGLSSLLGSLDHLGLPPLRGVFHAAAILDDCSASQLDAGRFARVMAPKAMGAWNLHQLTRDLPIEHFVMFSSISGMLGNAGQANYAAANAFLDGLARARAAQGLPGLSVSWGAIDDVGMVVADPGLKDQVQSRGVRLLPARRALSVLEECLRSKSAIPNFAIMDVEWNRLAERLSGSTTRFSSLLEETGDKGGADGEIKALLADLTLPQRVNLIADLLGETVSEVIGIARDAVAYDAPLNDQGLDSLMLVELQLGIRKSLGALIPSLEVSGAESVRDLASKILASLDSLDTDKFDTIASEVDSLSDSEVDEMLALVSQDQAAD
jgi:NAD(P)-dependent dehydrogenase (short-subunit alcohol dehydrogenase family)/acyl carrier protein